MDEENYNGNNHHQFEQSQTFFLTSNKFYLLGNNKYVTQPKDLKESSQSPPQFNEPERLSQNTI